MGVEALGLAQRFVSLFAWGHANSDKIADTIPRDLYCQPVRSFYSAEQQFFSVTDLMLKLRKHFLVLLIGIPLLLYLGACAPESTQGTTPDPEYGKGSLTVTISDTDLDEKGQSANITVQLDTPPKENVAVIATSSDPTEAQFVVNNQFQSSAELLFTPNNWDVPQILKIQGQYDEIIDNNQTVRVNLEVLSDDPVYDELNDPDIKLIDPTGGPANLTFHNVDMTDPNGIAPFATGGTVTELNPNEPGFEQAIFPIQLTSRPSSNVEVSIDFAPDTPEIAEALLSISPPNRLLTFTPENWQIPQSFIITAKQEDIDYSSNNNFTLNIESTGQHPFSNKFWSVAVNREDNDVPGIFVDYPDSMTTSEAGNKVVLGVRLKMKPDENVTVKFVSSDISEGKITSSNQGTLTFNRNSWNTTQNIEVTGQSDSTADGAQNYNLTYTFSGDTIYESINSTSLLTEIITNQDENTPGFTMQLGNLGLSESGNCDYLAVRLNTKPMNSVTVTPIITSNSPNKEADFVNDRTSCTNSNQIIDNCQPSPGSGLSFNSSNWNQSQLVCIKGEDDSDIDGSQQITLTIKSSSNDTNYNEKRSDFYPTNTDNDYAGILLGSVQYMASQRKYVLPVQLRAKPSSTVTVRLANDTSQIIKDAFETSSINFNSNNWNDQQFFKLRTGIDLSTEVTLQATGGGFNTTATTSLNLRSDNSGAAAGYEFIYFKEEAERFTSDDGGVYAFRLKLRNQPTAPVYLRLRSDEPGIGNPNRTGVTLDSTNWSLGEEIKVIGLDDKLNGNQAYRIQFYDVSSTDINYDNLLPQDIHLVNLDDDYRPSPLTSDIYEFDNTTTISGSCAGEISGDTSDFNISLPISVVKETDSPVATIKIALSQPIEGTVKLRIFSEDESEGYLIDEGSNPINFQDIIFNESNATTYQDISILGSQDWIDDGHQPFKIQLSVLNTNIPDYFGKSVSICLENEDDDKSGVEFNFGMSDENLLATSTIQDEAKLGLRLLSEPENEVLFNFGSTNNFTVSPNTLSFSSERWSEFQEITVINKSIASVSDNLSITLNTNDPVYSNIFSFTDINNSYFQNKIPVYYQDDELQDLLIYMPKNEYINESGAQQEFTVKLRSKPSSGKEVFLPLSTSDSSEGRVSPTILIFDSTNWQTPQTIRVTGIDDYQIDGSQQFEVVIGAADKTFQKADPNYTTPERIVRFISLDSTEAGFIVYALDEQTDEAGGDAQITIQLKSKPKADVIISTSSTDTTKAVITQGSFLTFTTSNWFQPQTIKLIGLADGSTANDQDYSLEFSNSSSDDSNYDGLEIQSVPLKHLNLN